MMNRANYVRPGSTKQRNETAESERDAKISILAFAFGPIRRLLFLEKFRLSFVSVFSLSLGHFFIGVCFSLS